MYSSKPPSISSASSSLSTYPQECLAYPSHMVMNGLVRAISPFSSSKKTINTKPKEEDDDEVNEYESFEWNLNGVNLSTALFYFYNKYNPSKADKIPQLLQEFEGEEMQLLQELCQKYSLTQNEMKQFLDRSRSSEQQKQFSKTETSQHFNSGLSYQKKDGDFDPNEDIASTDGSQNQNSNNIQMERSNASASNAVQPHVQVDEGPRLVDNSARTPPMPAGRGPPPLPPGKGPPPLPPGRGPPLLPAGRGPSPMEIVARETINQPSPLIVKSQDAVSITETRESGRVSPETAKKLAQQKILALAQRAKSPAPREIMAVGGQKVSIPPKPPPPPPKLQNDPPRPPPPPGKPIQPPTRKKSPSVREETLSDNQSISNATVLSNNNAFIFRTQPTVVKAAVVATTLSKTHEAEDMDDSHTNNSDLTRDDHSQANSTQHLFVLSSERSNVNDAAEQQIQQLKSELERARNESKEMFSRLTAMMEQQQIQLQQQEEAKKLAEAAWYESEAKKKHESEIVDEESMQIKIKAEVERRTRKVVQSLKETVDEKILAIKDLEEELRVMRYDFRRIHSELEDARADRRDVLNLLKSVYASPATAKAVLDSYVSQYELGSEVNKDYIVERIDSVLKYRRLHDFNDLVDDPINEILPSSAINNNLDDSQERVKSPKVKSHSNYQTSIFGSPKAVPGMAKSHTVVLKEILESNEGLEHHRQYTQSALGKLVDAGNGTRVGNTPGSPLSPTGLRVTSGGLISSDPRMKSPSSSVHTSESPSISSRYMNINSNVVWDPIASKQTRKITQSLLKGESSGNSVSSSVSHSTGRRSYSPNIVSTLNRGRSVDSSSKLSSSTRSNDYRDPFSAGRMSFDEDELSDRYEQAKDYYRHNSTQAKVAAQTSQNRLNYQTGLTSEAMIESVLTLADVGRSLNQRSKYDADGFPDDWVEGWDDVRKRKYYYSKARKKSVWKLPDGSKGDSRPTTRDSSPAMMSSQAASYRTATPRKMNDFHGDRERSKTRGQSSWIPVLDPKTQRQYWYHSVTRQTSWVDPNH